MSVVLSEHLPLLATAPDGIQKLRGLILELAVRGKLVPQDPNDEPASELLKRIAKERARLEVDGTCKKNNAMPLVGEDAQPFALPVGWEWSCLSAVSLINPRNSAADSAIASFVPMAMIGTSFDGKHSQDHRKWAEIKQGFTHFAENDIGVAKITPCFENSKACVFENLQSGIGAGTTELHIVRPVGKTLVPRFVLAYLKAPMFLLVGETRMTGTAGQKRLPKGFLERNPFPLPPIAEQHRIVAKVDELMALCDRLEAEQTDAESSRAKLVETLLGTLTQSTDTTELAAHWQRLAEHFDTLFTTESSLDALKQTILQLAVLGRLVPQDRNDEPASELFKRICVEKETLLKKGGLKKDKAMWDGHSEIPPHDLPSSWIWVRLQDVFEISRGGSPRPAGDPRYFGGPIPWITVGEITKDDSKFLLGTNGGLTEEGAERSRFVNPGDLLLTNSGATLGVPKISKIRACMNDGVAVLRQFHPFDLNDFSYLYLWSQTPAFRRVNQGMGQPNLNTPIIAGWHFPLPPLAEQHRIVAKVDELMALCDRLKADLAESHTRQAHLSGTLIESALQAA